MDMMDVPHLADKNKAKQKQYICNCLYGEDLSNVFFHTSSFLAHYSLRFLFFPDRRGKRWGFLLLYPICLKIQHGEMLFRSSWWLFKFEPGTIAMPWLKSLRWLRFLPCSGEYKNMNVNWNSLTRICMIVCIVPLSRDMSYEYTGIRYWRTDESVERSRGIAGRFWALVTLKTLSVCTWWRQRETPEDERSWLCILLRDHSSLTHSILADNADI